MVNLNRNWVVTFNRNQVVTLNRNWVVNLTGICNTPKDFIIEIPFAKITRKGSNFNVSLNWYEQQMDNLIEHTLSNRPFDL